MDDKSSPKYIAQHPGPLTSSYSFASDAPSAEGNVSKMLIYKKGYFHEPVARIEFPFANTGPAETEKQQIFMSCLLEQVTAWTNAPWDAVTPKPHLQFDVDGEFSRSGVFLYNIWEKTSDAGFKKFAKFTCLKRDLQPILQSAVYGAAYDLDTRYGPSTPQRPFLLNSREINDRKPVVKDVAESYKDFRVKLCQPGVSLAIHTAHFPGNDSEKRTVTLLYGDEQLGGVRRKVAMFEFLLDAHPEKEVEKQRELFTRLFLNRLNDPVGKVKPNPKFSVTRVQITDDDFTLTLSSRGSDGDYKPFVRFKCPYKDHHKYENQIEDAGYNLAHALDRMARRSPPSGPTPS